MSWLICCNLDSCSPVLRANVGNLRVADRTYAIERFVANVGHRFQARMGGLPTSDEQVAAGGLLQMRRQREIEVAVAEAEARCKELESELNLKEQRQGEIAYDRVTVRMPRAPEVKNVVDGIAGDAWTKFGIGTIAFAAQRDEQLGEMYDQIMQDPSCDARQILDKMIMVQRKLDQAIFTSINEYASNNIMMLIGDMKECKHGTMYNTGQCVVWWTIDQSERS